MKNTTVLISFVVLGVGFFYLSWGKMVPQLPASLSELPHLSGATAKFESKNPKGQPPRGKAEMTSEEIKQMEVELLTKMAQLTKPDEERKMLLWVMKRREPAYRALFDAWRLDQATEQSVRQMIWDREWEQALWILKSEATKADTWQASDNAKLGARYLWDSQIADLVGNDRFKQLQKVASDDQARMAQEARKVRGLDD